VALKLGTLWKVDQKYLASFEMWCMRRTGKIRWTYHVRNEEVLQRVKRGDEYPTNHKKRRKTNWIGQVLRRNCLLKHDVEGKIEG
jgi:hypothetical protein